jgi:Tfp pilus assembly protein PilE
MGNQRGASLVEIAIVVVVVAIVGAALYAYFASTAKTLEVITTERPLSQARFTADRATLDAIRSSLQVYYGQNGKWPASKDAVAALLNPPPAFQCEGNEYDYDPSTGQVSLRITDAARC